MRKKIFILSIFLFLLAGFYPSIKAAQNNKEIELYFFWGQGCPYCAKAKLFVKELKKEFPNLKVIAYEVNKNKDNYKFFQAMSQAYKIEEGIPLFLMGDNFLSGYDEASDDYLRKMVKNCINSNCSSPLLKLEQANNKNIVSKNKDKKFEEKNNNSLFFLIIIFIVIIALILFFKKRNKKINS